MAGLKAVGDFELVKAEMITSSGMVIDLSASILNITIFEDTTMTAVSGDILIQDSFALTSLGPIIGQEYLKLKIQTPTLTDEEEITETEEIIAEQQQAQIIARNGRTFTKFDTVNDIVDNQTETVTAGLWSGNI